MNARELRIGNWIHLPSKGKEYKISSGHDIEEIEGSDDATPIPLTPEWLERFGFEKRGLVENKIAMLGDSYGDMHGATKYVLGCKYVYHLGNSFYYELAFNTDDYGHNIHTVEIKYVHQLQNLYFALTGEELELR